MTEDLFNGNKIKSLPDTISVRIRQEGLDSNKDISFFIVLFSRQGSTRRTEIRCPPSPPTIMQIEPCSDNVPEISSVRPVRACMPQGIVGLTESAPDSTLGAKDLTFRMRTYMDEHYRTLSAVFPIILREIDGDRQVLLHRRANTGYMDGKWDFAGSGHVEKVETAKMAVVRECIEELGIIVDADDVRFAHLSHRLGRQGARTYYDIYFIVHKYDGAPMIAEPEKCSALEWFSIDALPMEMIDLRRRALEDCLKGIPYSEIITKPQQD